jgi:hypothetical protein
MSASAVAESSGHDALVSPDLSDERRRFLEGRVVFTAAGRIAEKKAWRGEKLWPWWRYRVNQDRANAFHEAAHAVIAELEVEGRFTHFASIVPSSRAGGYVITSTSADPLPPSPLSSSLPTDRQTIAKCCLELGSGWRGAIREYHRLHHQAETMVSENWPAIRAVAKALSEQRELNRQQFLDALSTHQSQQFIEIAATGVAVHNHA